MFNSIILIYVFEANNGAGIEMCDCKRDWLWVRVPLEKMKYLFKYIFPFLHSGVEAKPPEFSGKWETEYLNTRFPLPSLLCQAHMQREADNVL